MAGGGRHQAGRRNPGQLAGGGLKPRGVEPGPFRTPLHIADPHGHSDVYAVKAIHSAQLEKGVTKYHVELKAGSR